MDGCNTTVFKTMQAGLLGYVCVHIQKNRGI